MANSLVKINLTRILKIILSISFLIIFISFLLITQFNSFNPQLNQIQFSKRISDGRTTQLTGGITSGCEEVHKFKSYREKCDYLNSELWCRPDGYISYLQLFYCTFGQYPVLGYTVLILWLLILFYMLGNTAAHYFCSNLEALSGLLHLSPTIAGVTLLSLGNGAPDAFSTIVSFVGNGAASVGLNSVLGGVFVVSSLVVGIISILVSPQEVSIDRPSFIRDVCFLIFVLLVVMLIIAIGKINLVGAIAFASLYLVYVFLVWITHACKKRDIETGIPDELTMPITYLKNPISEDSEVIGELGVPLLGCSEEKNQPSNCLVRNVSKVLFILELPLYLPRRLTIPDVCEERWSKPFAVISVSLAPVLLATLWNSKREEDMNSIESSLIFLSGGSLGLALGITALIKTKREGPPTRFLFAWLGGGFLMSVIWAYMIAQELVSLLISLGIILQISTSILGLTVLAWGNSLGDLISNVAVAVNGSPGGAQVAVSGCYGGPVFNLLVGLGFSLVLCCWAGYPSPVVIPQDPTLYETLGFLIGGLLWALVMVPKRGMRLDRGLGYGLLSIYLCFLVIRLAQSVGLLQL
ncbi:Sodium/calcium exchanger family protein [Rhynchospora pubera]|uniref:Sodium/calcium exchanger family protein n=1 Tax=Rhynchospora pubera TaxID=906938 RepID=A0AAV8C6U9_9POAL|nr:Sodium/calcium exchanger family protein [Rhynchospora pubera]